ncbi:MAG: TonB-dependent receptor, partial [Bacteroidales bacterium]|nr:TonB-dependent receptor [Bacteroidales bacterium]
MKTKVSLLIIIIFLVVKPVIAQQKHTISGYIKDAETGEELIGATIYIKELKTGGITNVYGFYSLTIPGGKYIIDYSYIGYTTKSVEINLAQSIMNNIELSTTATSLEEVVISAEAADKNIKSSEMSVVKLNPKEIQTIPVIFGEQDLLKTIQLMPGVKSAGEGNSGFFVRGGSADQNLIYLDEAPVYNASHLLGFFSVFNSDAIKNMKLYKGNAPAKYGGRLSSVLDIKMNEGNSKKLGVSGGLGLISSRLTIEAPIVKNKGSFIISGRRTYADFLLTYSSEDLIKNTTLYFYDLNMKANYRISDNDRIFLSGYFGRDVFGFSDMMKTDWGNATATLRWNHLFSDKLFLNSSLIYSKYNYVIGFSGIGELIDVQSGIQDFNLKEDFQYFINPENTLNFGLNCIYHTFMPGELSSSDESFINSQIIDEKYAIESAAYISHKFDISNSLKLTYGLRYSNFAVIGPGNVYTFNDDDEITDTISYNNGELVKNYGQLEPRISVNYILNEQTSVKTSYARNTQYIHLLSNATSSTPTDLWLPSSSIIKPQIADQIALGYFRNFNDNMFETSVEVYYKNLQNQIDYKNGADILLNDKVESQLVFGKGHAYGVEFLIKKRTGKFTGWIGYTLSKTERTFDEINDGAWYPAKQDRTHDVSIVSMYNLTKRWTISATWIYYTGDAVTFPSGKYVVDGLTVPMYTDRNAYRMPDYHRLDLGFTYVNKDKINKRKNRKKKYESSWNISVYNVYARKNAYSIDFRENENDPTKTEAVRLALFQIVPSITYNFKF